MPVKKKTLVMIKSTFSPHFISLPCCCCSAIILDKIGQCGEFKRLALGLVLLFGANILDQLPYPRSFQTFPT